MDALISVLADPKVIALVAPLLVAALKKVTSKVPASVLPVVSLVLGAALSAVAGGDLASGAAAGLAGVGVREALDQAKKRLVP